MGVKLTYSKSGQADYSFPTDFTLIPMVSEFEHDRRGNPFRRRDLWRLRSIITAAGEAAIKTATDLLYARLISGGAATLYQTDGSTVTAHVLSDCRILSIGWPEPTGPELFNRRTVEISFESFSDIGSDNLVSFQESMHYSGGGPRWAIQEGVEGPPVRDRTAEQTAFLCTQTGSAEGRNGFPALGHPRTGAPMPRFMAAVLHGEPEYNQYIRYTADGQKRYVTTWSWRHASATNISGGPASWGPST